MDKGTFDRIRDLRGQAAKVAREHKPPASQEHADATPEQRFKAMGKLVMDGDDYPSTKRFGAKKFVVHAFLPDGVTVRLIAETSMMADHPALNDLVTLKTEWSTGSVDNPGYVDSVSNISDQRRPSDYELNELALVEESFAEARPHVSA